MGLSTVKAAAQAEPIRLELLGTTEYITETLTKIRPMFKGRVDKVHVAINQAVKKGDPLVDLYSKDLAEAKSAYEIERIQWVYDKNLLDTREPLVQSKAISQQLFEETRNNEMKSRREYEVARDKLFVYGLSEDEVERVETEAGVAEGPDDAPLPRPTDSSSNVTWFRGTSTTRMTLCSSSPLWTGSGSGVTSSRATWTS